MSIKRLKVLKSNFKGLEGQGLQFEARISKREREAGES